MRTLKELQDLINRHHAWALEKFPDETLDQKLIHLKREVDEVRADPADLFEFADCGLLLLHSLKAAGFTLDELISAMEAKFIRVQAVEKWVRTAEGDYKSVKPEAVTTDAELHCNHCGWRGPQKELLSLGSLGRLHCPVCRSDYGYMDGVPAPGQTAQTVRAKRVARFE